MKISVITAVFNNAATIEETILSVAAQTHPDVEHILIDGASTDGTREVLERYRPRLGHVVSEPDCGVFDAMNKGLALATGDAIGFLNADDAFASPAVLAQVAEALAPPDIDACYANLNYVRRDDPSRVVRQWRSRPYQSGLLERGWLPAHPTFYAKRRVYEKSGGFDLSFKLAADFELAVRLMAVHRIRTVFVPDVWVRMRMGGMSNRSVANVLRGNWEAYRACRKNNIPIRPWFPVTKILSRIPQFAVFRPER